MKIVDPLKIKQDDLPLFVFSDDMRGFMSWAIKAHSKGNWNHCMCMVNPGKVVTQGWTYKEIPISDYMKSGIRLKFWQCRNLTQEDKNDINKAVEKDLKQGWWRKRYDWLGIIGQALHIRWLNFSTRKYCSERVSVYLRLIGLQCPVRPTPSEINAFFIKNSRMYLYGYWDFEFLKENNGYQDSVFSNEENVS